jgi:hypothetical protein
MNHARAGVVLVVALAAAISGTSFAQPASKPVRIEGVVTAIGESPRFLCGYIMARQNITIRVTRAPRSQFRRGKTVVIPVLACFEGRFLTISPTTGLVELDPSIVKVGAKLAIDGLPATGAFYVQTKDLTVLP